MGDNHNFDERWKIINEFKSTRANFDVDKLKIIKRMCREFLNYRDDNHIANINDVCSALLKLNENDLMSAKKIAKRVWNDLSKRDTWFFDDILLINNILFLFKKETMREMYNRAINYLKKYEGFHDNLDKNIQFSLKFNKLSYDMFYGNPSKKLQKIVDNLIVQAHHLRYYDIKSILFIRKGLLLNNNRLIEKGVRILELLELNELLLSVRKEIHLFNKKNFSTYEIP